MSVLVSVPNLEVGMNVEDHGVIVEIRPSDPSGRSAIVFEGLNPKAPYRCITLHPSVWTTFKVQK